MPNKISKLCNAVSLHYFPSKCLAVSVKGIFHLHFTDTNTIKWSGLSTRTEYICLLDCVWPTSILCVLCWFTFLRASPSNYIIAVCCIRGRKYTYFHLYSTWPGLYIYSLKKMWIGSHKTERANFLKWILKTLKYWEYFWCIFQFCEKLWRK